MPKKSLLSLSAGFQYDPGDEPWTYREVPPVSRKTFILDTNVLLHDTDAVMKFPGHNVVVCLTVLEELDKLKRNPGELGKNARHVIRFLDGLKARGGGGWHEGIDIENGARVLIELDSAGRSSKEFVLNLQENDNRIIEVAYLLKKEGARVVFVSKDFAARIKAEALGLEAEDYENLKAPLSQLHRGIQVHEVEKRSVDEFYRDGHLPLNGVETRHNEYCVLKSAENSSAVGVYDAPSGSLRSIRDPGDTWGIKPRNVEQRCALDLLLRDDINLVTLVGPAGTGKTLLALAAALRKVFDEEVYTRILVSRPIIPLGRDIGYLPGAKDEKLMSWMQPIYDNLAFICDSNAHEPNETLRWVTESKRLEMEAVTYIRGRSLPKMFIIIDEAQNLTPHEVKTIISRAGEGTKVVLAGDPFQIDNPYLDKDSNGLTFTADKFCGQKLFGHMYLDRTERSELAALAAEIM